MNSGKQLIAGFALALAVLFSINVQAGDGDKSGAQKVKKKDFETNKMIGMLDVNKFTTADLEVVKQYRYDLSPEQVWKIVSVSENIPDMVKSVKSVKVNHSKEDDLGVGCVRECSFGGESLTEEVVYVEQNKVFAYKVMDNDMVSNHLGVMKLDKDGDGTVLTWYQYFDPGAKKMKASMMKMMMGGVLKDAMKNVEDMAAM